MARYRLSAGRLAFEVRQRRSADRPIHARNRRVDGKEREVFRAHAPRRDVDHALSAYLLDPRIPQTTRKRRIVDRQRPVVAVFDPQ